MKLDIRFESHDFPIGTLKREGNLALNFQYNEDFLTDGLIMPISLGLPLRYEPYSDLECRSFFQNLLPENDQVERTANREGLDRADIAGLLYHLGADCAGAISCLPYGSDPIKKPGIIQEDYDELNEEVMNDIVSRLANREHLPAEITDPSPVAGVQRKIALTFRPDGTFALPKKGSRVPTTHILKVPRFRESRDTLLEMAAAVLADRCNLETSIPAAIKFGDHEALLIKRFDREVDETGAVRRIHQEDFAQALGIASEMKYERYGVKGRTFNTENIRIVLDNCIRPAEARDAFMKATIFNLAIGNTDNHAKNFALLYDMGPIPRLAPLYDMLPIKLSDKYTHELAFKIGNAVMGDNITREDFNLFFNQMGLTETAYERFRNESIRGILVTLDQCSEEELVQNGLRDFDCLFGVEAEKIADKLDLDINFRERDFFAATAGGWNFS